MFIILAHIGSGYSMCSLGVSSGVSIWSESSKVMASGILGITTFFFRPGSDLIWAAGVVRGVAMGGATGPGCPVPRVDPMPVTGGGIRVSFTIPNARQGHAELGTPTATAPMPALPFADVVAVRAATNGDTGIAAGLFI